MGILDVVIIAAAAANLAALPGKISGSEDEPDTTKGQEKTDDRSRGGWRVAPRND